MDTTPEGLPPFLFFFLPPDLLERGKQGDDLVAPVGGVLAFYDLGQIMLERGVTFDPVFHNWANEVYSPQGQGGVSLANFRKDILINLMNLQGVVVRSYKVFRCWPSEYVALPELDANNNAVAITPSHRRGSNSSHNSTCMFTHWGCS